MEEVGAATSIAPHMLEGRPLPVRVSANMALFTLACRNGLAVCTADGIFETMCSSYAGGERLLIDKAGSGFIPAGALDIAAATSSLFGLCIEVCGKCGMYVLLHFGTKLTLTKRVRRTYMSSSLFIGRCSPRP
eukprot:SAG31_NODE_10633_length_1114_cov_4.225616_1_plen_133_part_00